MKCEEFEQGWELLGNPSDISHQMEKHREACPACAEFSEDLENIIIQTRALSAQDQPSGNVWKRIQLQLEAEGLTRREEQKGGFQFSMPWFGWLPRFSMGLSYAAVFFVALGVLYVLRPVTNDALSGTAAITTQESAQEAPQMTAAIPVQASPQVEQDIREMVEKVPPEKRQLYEVQINRVTSSIQQLQSFITEHPEDPFVREQLFNAYEHQKRLWETMVKWEEF